MRVKCKENYIHNFSDNKSLYLYLTERIHLDDGILALTINKEYNVYTVKYNNQGFIEYLICDDNFSFLEYPLFYLSDFFEIIDNRVSKYWENLASTIFQEHELISLKLFSFKEWNMGNFYENLVNLTDAEIKIFGEYKSQMDVEFYDK